MKYLCEIYVSEIGGHCPNAASVVKVSPHVTEKDGTPIRIILCADHGDIFSGSGGSVDPVPWDEYTPEQYTARWELVQDSVLVSGRINPKENSK